MQLAKQADFPEHLKLLHHDSEQVVTFNVVKNMQSQHGSPYRRVLSDGKQTSAHDGCQELPLYQPSKSTKSLTKL